LNVPSPHRQSPPTAAPSASSPPQPDAAENLSALGEEASRSLGKERRQIFLLVLLVATFMSVAHFTPLSSWLDNAQEWKRSIREFGWAGHLGFFLVTALAVMFGVPRLTLCGTAGLLFGFTEGVLLSLFGSALGSYGTFLMVRRGFRKSVARHASARPWLSKLLEKPSLLKVFWVRQLALPGLVLNAIFGLTTIRHRIFLGGTLLGYIPLNLAATLVGSGLGKESLKQTAFQLLAALAVINIVMWLVWRRFKQPSATPSATL
jgi:uncharacterized membrane protein YdjX (TVP38/TMEM64 family)